METDTDAILDELVAWITGQGVPLLVGLLTIGVVVSLLVNFAIRAARGADYSGRWDARWPDGNPVELYDDNGDAWYEW